MSSFFYGPITFSSYRQFFSYISIIFAEMEAAKQRIRAAIARQKEEKRANEELTSSSAPKAVSKDSSKTKPDGKDGHPLK